LNKSLLISGRISRIVSCLYMKKFICLFSILFFCSSLVNAQGYLKMKEKAEEAFNNYEYGDAVTWASDALLLAEVEVGENSVEYANCLNDLGIYKYYNYQFEEGIQLVEDACMIKKNLLGENNLEYLLSYSDLGSLYYMNEENEKALKVFVFTSKMQREVSGAKSTDLAYELNKLGLVQTNLGVFNEAEKNLKECRRIFEYNQMSKSPDYGSLLNNFANLYHSKGNYLDAEEYYLKANKHFAKTEGKKAYNYSVGTENLGNLYGEMGRYEKAKQLFIISLGINEELFGENSLEYAKSLNDLAFTNHHLGDYVTSEKEFRQSLEIKKSLAGENTPTYNRTLNNLAVLYLDYGNSTEALKILEPLVNMARNQVNSSPFSFITYAQNLVVLYFQLNEFDKANSLQMEIIEIQKNITGEINHEYAMMLNNSAEIHRRRDDFKKSEEYLFKAREILEELGHDNTMDYLVIKYAIGINYLDKKDYQNAKNSLEETLNIARKSLNKKNALYIDILINLGEALKKLNELEKAEPMYAEAMDIYAEIADYDLTFMSTIERSEYLHQIKIHLALYNAFALQLSRKNERVIEDIYNYNVGFKNLELRSNIKQKNQILASTSTKLKDEYEDLQNNREYLHKLYQLPEIELQNSGINVDSLELSTNKLEKKIYAYLGNQNGSRNNKMDYKNLSQMLSTGEVAIEMIRIPHYGDEKSEFDIDYLGIIIYPNGENKYDHVVYKNGRKLENELSDLYYSKLFNKSDDVNSYHIFWKPIADKILDYNTVYLSRSGIFNIINVNTLKGFESQQYVIDTWDIHYVTSTTDIDKIKSKKGSIDATNSGNIHLFGYPDYYYNLATQMGDQSFNDVEKLTSSRQIDAELQYISELPGTKREVESINEILSGKGWDSKIYIDKQATEANIKALNNPKVLHLATHGFFEFENQESSASATSLNRSMTLSQPLLRSGIMMAGSAYVLKLVKENVPFISEFEDGVLNGFEASNLRLDNTDLVVLSACLTSVGAAKVNDNESYFGMLSAFLSAGAESVIASCWSVDDEATKDLMISFYSNWSPEENYYNAFKKAQLATKEKYDQPYYWGAFIMVE